jgi:hypothetical protein
VDIHVLKRFKLFHHGVSKLSASSKSRVAALSMSDSKVYFAGPVSARRVCQITWKMVTGLCSALQVGDDKNRDMKMLCHADLAGYSPVNAEWVGEDVVILAASTSQPPETKFVGIHTDYITEVLDAEPIPPTWSFVHNERISGCLYLPLSRMMVFHAHDRCSLWTCSWDHCKQHELADEVRRSALTAQHNAPVIAACTTSSGELVATASSNGTVCLWQPTENGLVSVGQTTVHSACISSLCFSLGARTLLTSAVNGSVVLHELKAAGSSVEQQASIEFMPLASVGSELDHSSEPKVIPDQVTVACQ